MKALIVVQGVNHIQGYLYEDAQRLSSYYDKIVDVDIGQHFKHKKGFVFKVLGKFGDKLNDVWDFYISTEERKAVCREVRKTIRDLQAQNYDVSVLAHSLGTVITLCSGPNSAANPVHIDKLIMMQSPLGIASLVARMYTNQHTEKYSNNFTVNELHYTWSKWDFISSVFTNRINSIIMSKSKTYPKIYHTHLGHSSKDAINYILKRTDIFENNSEY
jgi:hypothetical protein